MDKFEIMTAKNRLIAALNVSAAAESNLTSAGYGLKFRLVIALTNLEYPITPVTFQCDFESLMIRLRAHNFSTEDISTLLYRGKFVRVDGVYNLWCLGDKLDI